MSKKENPLIDHFPIYPSYDYDMSFLNMNHPIGINSTAPCDLIRRVVAAAISHRIGSKGIDYTYKRYMEGTLYKTNDGSRIDIRISDALDAHSKCYSALVYHVTTLEPKTIGNMVSEWTMLRVPHSVRQLLTLAHRGNLYESCAVGRAVLEQVAWANEIDAMHDAEEIKRRKAEGSIRVLKKSVPYAGVLYGWLSSHSHWRYEDHVKAMTFSEEGMMTTLQSSKFKAVSLCMALLLISAATLVLYSARRNEISALMESDPDTKLINGKRTDSASDPWFQLLGPPTSSIADIREMLTFSQPLSLLDEVVGMVELDKDIRLISRMAGALRKIVARP